MNDNNSINVFFEALMQVQAELPEIKKTREARVSTQKGGMYSYKYADLATILRSAMPILHKHGFVIIHYPEFEGDDVLVKTVLRHISGHSESVTVRIRRGVTPQDAGSAITYARRYGIQCLLGIAADDDDDAAAVTEAIRDNELSEVASMLDEAETLEPGVRKRFLAHFRIRDVYELRGDALPLAKKLLTVKLETLKNKQG